MERSARPTVDSPSVSEETLTEAMERLRLDGYTSEFFATSDGRLDCRSCETTYDPASILVDHTVRFEGDSNPDDEAILLALRCHDGCMGLYTSAFGPTVPTPEAEVLRLLARPPAM